MPIIPIQFGLNSYQALSGLLSSERVINFYAEPAPTDSPFKVVLYGTPGQDIWSNLGLYNPVYGFDVMGDNLYVVCGVEVYKIDTSKTKTHLGTMGTAPGRVIMINNGTQVTIRTESGICYYCTETADSLTQITDGNFATSGSITNIDGFTISAEDDSYRYQISSLNNTAVYNALDFDSVLATSDKIVRVIANNLEVWFFKQKSTLVYYNSAALNFDPANPNFPFSRKNGVFIQKGCAAKHAVSIYDNKFYFLGNDNILYKTNGYQLESISTAPFSKAVESYPQVSDAFSMIYTQGGHPFFVITFPSANATWHYDIATGLLAERQSLNPVTLQPQEWKANCLISFAGKELVGDPNTGIIHELNLDTYTESNEMVTTPIISKVISATQFDNYNRDAVGTFMLVMDTGVGINDGQGVDPQIMMRTSIDGGKTWSNEMWQPLGAQGQYDKEVFWNRIAYGRSLIIEIAISDPVKRAILQAYLDVNQGTP